MHCNRCSLTDFYNIIDQLNAPIRVAMNSYSDEGDLFEPYELVMPVFLVVLKDAKPERLIEPAWSITSYLMDKPEYNET